MLKLELDEIRVYLARPDSLSIAHERVLDASDRAHVARFRFAHDRALATSSRILQRLALSDCAGVEPAAWRFVADESGKPSVAAPAGASSLCFNVANTGGLVVCAVSLDRALGIDVEQIRPSVPDEVVERCWSERERADLSASPAAERSTRFARTWVAKEAYVKARGVGLSIELARVDVRFDDDRPRLQIDADVDADSDGWELVVWSPTASHAAALCVRNDGQHVRCVTRWMEDRLATPNARG